MSLCFRRQITIDSMSGMCGSASTCHPFSQLFSTFLEFGSTLIQDLIWQLIVAWFHQLVSQLMLVTLFSRFPLARGLSFVAWLFVTVFVHLQIGANSLQKLWETGKGLYNVQWVFFRPVHVKYMLIIASEKSQISCSGCNEKKWCSTVHILHPWSMHQLHSDTTVCKLPHVHNKLPCAAASISVFDIVRRETIYVKRGWFRFHRILHLYCCVH